MIADLEVDVVHATEHMPDHYRRYIDGWRAVRLTDAEGGIRGELVWRYATGDCVEITEFGIFNEDERRQGLGTRLLEAALRDMQGFAQQIQRPVRLVYLFTEARLGAPIPEEPILRLSEFLRSELMPGCGNAGRHKAVLRRDSRGGRR